MTQVTKSVQDVNEIRRELEETKAALTESRRELEETKAALARKTSKVCALQEEIRDLRNGAPPPACRALPVNDEMVVEVPRPGFDLNAAAQMIDSMICWAEGQSGQRAPELVRKFTEWLGDAGKSVA